MKTLLSLTILLMICSSTAQPQSAGSCVTDAILAGYSPRSFSAEPVTDQQIDLILRCGIKAPSGRNLQPWKFTVVKDTAAMRKVIRNITPGNILIIVSGLENQQTGAASEFDCALATHSMFIAALGIGLGARIYGGPIGVVNSARETFAIPAGYKPVIALRIGNIDKSVDATSAATQRKKMEEIVNYLK